MDEAFRKFVENNWPKTKQDYKDSIDFVNKFFDRNIIHNILNWNECINMERKGAAIYKEQQNRNRILNSLHTLSNKDIIDSKEFIESRSILIFDDSIKNGITIRPLLNLVSDYEPSDVTVGTLIAREDSLNALKNDFPMVKFCTALMVNSDDFGVAYAKKLFPYLGYICSPLQNDHPRLIIKFSEAPDERTIIKFFELYGDISYDKDLEIIGQSDRKQLSFILNNTFLAQFKILNVIEKLGIIDKNDILIKVKIYLKKDSVSTLTLQPMILEGINANGLVTKETIEHFDYHVKKMFLLEFLVEKFLLDYLINTEAEFSNFSVISN